MTSSQNSAQPGGASAVGSEVVRPGVSSATLAAAGVRKVEAAEAFTLVGYQVAGDLIPYRDSTGQPILRRDGQPFYRLRVKYPQSGGPKYLSPKGEPCQLYLPPADWNRAGKGVVFYIVEGEFKALAMTEAGFTCVGVGGINSVCPNNAAGDPELLPALVKLIAQVNPPTIAFIGDNDTALIPGFSQEAVKLAKLIGRPVILPRIPCDSPGKGVDDMSQQLGDKFANWWKQTVAEAEPVKEKDSAGSLAVRLLSREEAALAKMVLTSREEVTARLVKLGAGVSHEPIPYEALTKMAMKVLGITSRPFKNAVKTEIEQQAKRQLENAEAPGKPTDSDVDQCFFDGDDYYRSLDGLNFVDCANYQIIDTP